MIVNVLVESVEPDEDNDDLMVLTYYTDEGTDSVQFDVSDDSTSYFTGDAEGWDDVERYDVVSYLSFDEPAEDEGFIEYGIWVSDEKVRGYASSSREYNGESTPETGANVPEIRVDGVYYDMNFGTNGAVFGSKSAYQNPPLYSLDNTATFDYFPALLDYEGELNQFVGNDVTLHLDYMGDVFAITADLEDTVENVGIVTYNTTEVPASSGIGSQPSWEIELFLLDSGEQVIYTYEEEPTDGVSNRLWEFRVGAFVEYSLNEDGELDIIESYGSSDFYGGLTVDDGAGSLSVGDDVYFGDDDTVVVYLDAPGLEDIELGDWSEIMDQSAVSGASAYMDPDESDYDRIKYLFLDAAVSSGDTHAYVVFVDYEVMAEGVVSVSLLTSDGVYTNVYEDADEEDVMWLAGEICTYATSGGDISDINPQRPDAYGPIADIVTINGIDYISFGESLLEVTADTVFVDARDTGDIFLVDFEDIEEGDTVMVMIDSDMELEIVVLVTEDKD